LLLWLNCLSREFIAWDPVYTSAKDSGFVKLGGFLVFLVYGFMRRLHYTTWHSDWQWGKILTHNFVMLDHVWLLKLIAINLKNVRGRKFILILFRKRLIKRKVAFGSTLSRIPQRSRKLFRIPKFRIYTLFVKFCNGFMLFSVNGKTNPISKHPGFVTNTKFFAL
jgi:hypothetical protein